MKKLVLVLVLQFIFFINFQTTAQTNTREGTTGVNFFSQGYGINLLNSSGASSIFNDVSNLGFMNPASISEFENYSLGISYQFNTNIDEAWIADIGFDRVYDFYPQSFGGIAKWNDFSFGLGFGQKYNGSVDIGEIAITTVQNPEGTGEFITPIIENVIHTYSVSASYSFKELLKTQNEFSLGFRYNLNRFNKYDEIGDLIGKAEDYFHSFNIGLFSSLKLDENRNLSFGLSYETISDFNAKFEVNSELLQDPDPNNPPSYTEVEQYLVGSTPAELKLGYSIDASSELKFQTDLTAVFWESSTEYLKDQIEFSTSVVYSFNEQFASSVGFYFTDYKYKENYYSQLNSELNAFFITAGLNLKYENFYFDLAIADSHLLSGDFRKQTIFKLAIGVCL